MSKNQPEPKNQSQPPPSGELELIIGIDAIGKAIRRNPQGVLHAHKYDNLPLLLIGNDWISERVAVDNWLREMVLDRPNMSKNWEDCRDKWTNGMSL